MRVQNWPSLQSAPLLWLGHPSVMRSGQVLRKGGRVNYLAVFQVVVLVLPVLYAAQSVNS